MPERKTATVEVFVIVDEGGDAAIGLDYEQAKENFEASVGELQAPTRCVKVTLTVPLPVVTELTGTVPADDDNATLTVGAA